MSGFERWLSRLQLSPRSQRALTEAALDWQHEVATAPTYLHALWRHGRSALGFARAVLIVSAGSFGAVANWTWGPRFVVWMLAFLTLALWRSSRAGLWLPPQSQGLALLVTVRWVTWVPFGAVLTVLTGPKRADSPVTAVVVVVSVLACASTLTALFAYDPRLGTGVYPGYFGFRLWWYLPAGILVSAGLTLLADRVRIDDRRFIATAGLIPQAGGFIVLMVVSQWGLAEVGLQRYGGFYRALFMSALIVIPFALWARLVRKQERRSLAGSQRLRPTG